MNLNQGQGEVNGNAVVCVLLCLQAGTPSQGYLLWSLYSRHCAEQAGYSPFSSWESLTKDCHHKTSFSSLLNVPADERKVMIRGINRPPLLLAVCLVFLPCDTFSHAFPLRRMKNVSNVLLGRVQFLFRLEIDVSGACPLWLLSSHEVEN